jgi:hypothetical protein
MNTVESLREVVQEAGYVATIEGDLVLFKCEGTRYRFETFPDDTAYARLILTYALPDDIPEERLLAVANDRNRVLKAIKTVVAFEPGGFVAFSIEMFASDSGIWGASLDRLLRGLREASDWYFNNLTTVDGN